MKILRLAFKKYTPYEEGIGGRVNLSLEMYFLNACWLMEFEVFMCFMVIPNFLLILISIKYN